MFQQFLEFLTISQRFHIEKSIICHSQEFLKIFIKCRNHMIVSSNQRLVRQTQNIMEMMIF
ncbi:unnamed protein product [Paramecium octaurelia]|uniref:Uncharacterized protein n=1 Tax=Paramecium octaurelia TaxID=43137 RepID=A0A8S1XW28_PAROT|nr:unnamed protein product [Paramecium octaurelia]